MKSKGSYVYTVLSVGVAANDWDFVDGSGHLETVNIANTFWIGLRKWKR